MLCGLARILWKESGHESSLYILQAVLGRQHPAKYTEIWIRMSQMCNKKKKAHPTLQSQNERIINYLR